jgi:hypothetical protein
MHKISNKISISDPTPAETLTTRRSRFMPPSGPQVLRVLLAHKAPTTLEASSADSGLVGLSSILEGPVAAEAAALGWADLARLRRRWSSTLDLVPPTAAMTATAAARAAMTITCDFEAGGSAAVEVRCQQEGRTFQNVRGGLKSLTGSLREVTGKQLPTPFQPEDTRPSLPTAPPHSSPSPLNSSDSAS